MRDTELLASYLECGSESAFTELVNRHVNLAYSVAQRQLRTRELAEEVVQMTFCLLARKACSLTQYDSLAGWIHRTTFNLSLKALRQERTRRQRENTMAELHDSNSASASEQPWEHLLPLLDEAFSQLPDSDRTALVLRFAHGKAMRELGEAMGTTEAAAKMRVGRAIRRVREYFQKRGVACSSAQLLAALAALGTSAAPAGLAASAVAAALAGSAGTVAVGSAAKTMILMAKLKTKLVLVGLGTAAVLTTGYYLLDHSLSLLPAPSGGEATAIPGTTPAQPQRGQSAAASSETWTARLRDLGLARATSKLKAALNAPARKGTRSYPSKALEEAIGAFGPYQQHAFGILQEAILADELETRLQAIAALGRIGRNVPEARPLVWKLLNSGEDRISSLALGALGNMGILPEEIGSLAALIPGQTDQQLVRYLPEQIARAIQRDPAAMKPHLGPVEALLEDPDPAVRFSAACALAEQRGGEDPQILRGLAAGLAVSDRYRLRNEATGEVVRHLMAIETLQRMGSDATPVLPELQAFAGLTPDSVVRDLALRTIAAIDPDAGGHDPEIQAIVVREEQRNSLLDRLHSGNCSMEDLSQALKEPMAASLAATQLGILGSAARDRLPEMHQALAGKDEATRDEILSAMKQIDPNYVVARVPRQPVAHGTLAAQMELDAQRSQGELQESAASQLEKLIDHFRMGNTSWYTQREVAAFAQQLRKENPRIWTAFLTKASEVDPEFERTLSTFQAALEK